MVERSVDESFLMRLDGSSGYYVNFFHSSQPSQNQNEYQLHLSLLHNWVDPSPKTKAIHQKALQNRPIKNQLSRKSITKITTLITGLSIQIKKKIKPYSVNNL